MRAFRIAYDGRPYRGFQRQPDVATVSDAVLDACRDLGVCEDVPAGYAAAGRTDAGVSAIAQTVAFEAPDWLSPRALNARLPRSVRAWAFADVPPTFHATHDARAREYVYHQYAPEADLERAVAATATLSGRHDFRDLTSDDPAERETVRDLDVGVVRDGDYLVYRFRAGGFVRELVRRCVALVGAVATGDAPPEKVDRALAAEPLPDPAAVAPAPAIPLVLADVTYDVEFVSDPDAVADARRTFGTLRIERATGARVARALRDGVDP